MNRINQLIIDLNSCGIIRYGDFMLKSGISSPIYFDFRQLLSHPKLMNEITDQLISVICSDNLYVLHSSLVCGVPYGGIPYASIISHKISMNCLLMRKETKTHGTTSLIDGLYSPGDVVYLIEDVTTTAGSINQFKNMLESVGLRVVPITILDRRKDRSVYIKSIFTIDQVISTLTRTSGDQSLYSILKYPTKTYEKSSCQQLHKLNKIMMEKESNLCVAVDLNLSEQIFDLIDEIGDKICLLKTHADIVLDWCLDTEFRIHKMCQKYNFMWMEDRKYADISSVCVKQFAKFSVNPDFVTVHAIAGKETIIELSKQTGVVVIAEMSTENNLCTNDYKKATYETCMDLNIAGFVGQISPRNPKFVQMTPGINMDINKKTDGKGQTYQDIGTKIAFGADIIIVGRAITDCKTLEEASEMTKKYQIAGWTSRLEYAYDII